MTAGMTEEARQALLNLHNGLPLFQFLSSYPGPLRLSDLSAKARSLGVTTGLMPLTTFLGIPIRHMGMQMGNFYLANKEGGREFTDEDEEILVMFASQAALVIANARSTVMSSGPGRIWRRWSTPRRWPSWSSMPGRADRGPSTRRQGGSLTSCGHLTNRRKTCSR